MATQGHWSRSATYFILLFHSNYGNRTVFLDKEQYLKHFATLVYITPRWRGSTWKFATAVWIKNLEPGTLPDCPKKFDVMFIRLDTVYRHWMDRQADRRTALVKRYRALHADVRNKQKKKYFKKSVACRVHLLVTNKWRWKDIGGSRSWSCEYISINQPINQSV